MTNNVNWYFGVKSTLPSPEGRTMRDGSDKGCDGETVGFVTHGLTDLLTL